MSSIVVLKSCGREAIIAFILTFSLNLYFYRPQTKFGARQCFYTCLSVILFTVATEAGGTHPTGMQICFKNKFDTKLLLTSRRFMNDNTCAKTPQLSC